MSKIRLPHFYKGNNYVTKSFLILLNWKLTIKQIYCHKCNPERAKSRFYSLSRQNSVKFGTDFTRLRKKFTQTLFHVHTFLHLCCNTLYLYVCPLPSTLPLPTLQWPGQNGGNEAIRFKHRPARKAYSFLMRKLSDVCGTLGFNYGPANNVGGSLLHSPLYL